MEVLTIDGIINAPCVGEMVQYFTSRTIDRYTNERLTEPVQIGPFAALITSVNRDGSVHLTVFQQAGQMRPVFDVTGEPTTPVRHFWRQIQAGGL